MIRWMLGLGGLPVAGYGAWLRSAVRTSTSCSMPASGWAGGVLHDRAIAGAALPGAGLAAAPARAPRAPATVGLVVVGIVDAGGAPGARPASARSADNPTHLDRPYVAAWLVLVAVAILIVVVAGVATLAKMEV